MPCEFHVWHNGGGSVPAVEKRAFKVVAPAAAAEKDARLYELEFAAETKDGAKKTKLVLPEGFNHALGHKKAAEPSFCFFACDELAAKEVRFSVTPINCFGARGVPLVSEWVSL